MLHHGWVDENAQSLDISQWGETLAQQLETLRDVAGNRAVCEVLKRNEYADKTRIQREFKVGDFVWLRSPGLDGKLEASWLGPYQVIEKLVKLTTGWM